MNDKKSYEVVREFTLDGETLAFPVCYGEKPTFDSYDEAMEAVHRDMKSYAEAEKADGFETIMNGLTLDWKDPDDGRKVTWKIVAL